MQFYLIEDSPHQIVATQAEAKAEARSRGCSWSPLDIPTDKAGLMSYVNSLMERSSMQTTINVSNPMEGQPVEQPKLVDALPRVSQSVRFENEFEAMPLPLKLHYAALAMEAARAAL